MLRKLPMLIGLASLIFFGAAQAAGPSSPSALLYAAKAGNLPEVRRAIESGVPVNAVDSNGNTALLVAIGCNRTAIIDYLLCHGAKVNVRGPNQVTPLIMAAFGGQPEVLKKLLGAGADLKAVDDNGQPAIEAAVMSRDPASVRVLLKAGAFREVGAWGQPLIVEAANLQVPAAIVLSLLQAGAHVDARGRMGSTALMKAATNGDTATAEVLLEHGANVRLTDHDGETALAIAVTNGMAKDTFGVVNLLLKAGADPNARRPGGLSMLGLAVMRWDVRTVESLIAAGADPNVADDTGRTAFTVCPQLHRAEFLKLLSSHAISNAGLKAIPCGLPLKTLTWWDGDVPPLKTPAVARVDKGLLNIIATRITKTIAEMGPVESKDWVGEKTPREIAASFPVYRLDIGLPISRQYFLVPVNFGQDYSFYILAQRSPQGHWTDVSEELAGPGSIGGYKRVSPPMLLDLDCDGTKELLLRILDNGVRYTEGSRLVVYCWRGDRWSRAVDRADVLHSFLTDFSLQRRSLNAPWQIVANSFNPEDWIPGADDTDTSESQKYTHYTLKFQNCSVQVVKSEQRRYTDRP